MKLWRFVVWLVPVSLCAALFPAQTRSPAHQFQQAIDLMETKGDCPAAIRLFEQIAKGPDRALAARSLLYAGLCYERTGRDKAQKAYERVIREFADQRDVVAEVRVRLSALGLPATADASAMALRRVWAGPGVDALGAPSPDGRYLSYVDRATGDLAVRELATGTNRRLTNKGSWAESTEFAEFSIISPDGAQVAYAWADEHERYDLRLIRLAPQGPSEGRSQAGPAVSAPRVLYRSAETEYIQPADWSPDGKQILALLHGKDGAKRIALVSVADGSVRILKTLDWRYPLKMCFSPDGRYVAYDFPPKESLPERDIFLLAVDDSREIPLVEHPANDFLLGWAPKGDRILFASDRTRTLDAWAIQVTNGKPQGNPELVKQDIGPMYPMGFTRSGSYYYGRSLSGQDVYVATLDPATGKAVDSPVPASRRYVGARHWPDWSPDGKYLAYVSWWWPVGSGSAPPLLVIQSVETGEQRNLFPRVSLLSRLRWSPDGRFIIANGRDHMHRGGLFRVDVQTGDATAIVYSPRGFPRQAAWSADGRAVFYSHYDGPVLLRDLATGQEKEICPGAVFALSPDYQWLALPEFDPLTKSTGLKVVPSTGGQPRELLRLTETGAFMLNLAWSADGRYLLFGKSGATSQSKTELWRIPVQGGEPENLGLSVERMVELRVHPDGRRIAFTAGSQRREIWAMENFLPALNATRSQGRNR
jgi:Tol biopolymer transport system component